MLGNGNCTRSVGTEKVMPITTAKPFDRVGIAALGRPAEQSSSEIEAPQLPKFALGPASHRRIAAADGNQANNFEGYLSHRAEA